MRTDPPQQQVFVPVIPAPGFTAAVPQAAIMQLVMPVQQVAHPQIPVEDFRKEVGKKLLFVLLFASNILLQSLIVNGNR